MGLVQEESHPIAKVTLKPLGTVQECTDLKKGKVKLLRLRGSAGLTFNQFSVPGLSHRTRVTPAIGFIVYHLAASVLKSLDSSRTREE